MVDDDEPDYRLDALDDYCLLNILHYLDLKSKLELLLTCKKLNKLISRWFASQKFFGDPGYSLVKLCTEKGHCMDEYQYSLQSLTECCSNRGWNLSIMLFNRIFQLAKNVECLHFNCLDGENPVDERLLFSILSLPKITCLSFGVGLQVSARVWISIISQFGNQLRHLQINRVSYMTLQHIVKHTPNLISLQIRFCPKRISCLSFLRPKLRRLRIQSIETIYLRNPLFTSRPRQANVSESDDEETVDLTINEINDRNPDGNPTGNPNETHNDDASRLRAERKLSLMESVWYWNLIELRLTNVTVGSLTVLFNHCINLEVLDVVLFFHRSSVPFENQNFIQLAYRMHRMRLFALDVHNKWLIVQLDRGLALALNEWPKLEVLIVKRGLITEELFSRIKQDCRHLKVISVEFYDCIPYNHRLNEITDRVVDSLVELNELVMLRLHFTGLTDNGVTQLLDNCPHLKYLDLFGCLKITRKSLQAIVNRLNRANRCNAIFLNKNAANRSVVPGHDLSDKSNGNANQKDSNKSRSPESPDQESLGSFETYSTYSCSQFDIITANCIGCGKKPATFYVSFNRTKIDLKRDRIRPPNTLFVLNEDDPKWNCYNYPNTL